MHLTAKFHRPTFNRSEVIVLTNKLTNKQMPLKTSTSLRYATPVGKNSNTPMRGTVSSIVNLWSSFSCCLRCVVCWGLEWHGYSLLSVVRSGAVSLLFCAPIRTLLLCGRLALSLIQYRPITHCYLPFNMRRWHSNCHGHNGTATAEFKHFLSLLLRMEVSSEYNQAVLITCMSALKQYTYITHFNIYLLLLDRKYVTKT